VRLWRRIRRAGDIPQPLGRASVPPDPTSRDAGGGTGRVSHYEEPRTFPSYGSSGNNSALDFPARNPRSTAGHRSGIPCRASQRHPRNALPISSSALRLGTPRTSSAFTVSRTSSFSRIKLRTTLAISFLDPGMGLAPLLKDDASRKRRGSPAPRLRDATRRRPWTPHRPRAWPRARAPSA